MKDSENNKNRGTVSVDTNIYSKRDRETAVKRANIIADIRAFFTRRTYLEVETPDVSRRFIPESTIHLFTTTYSSTYKDSMDMYLLPSPELFHKQLIGDGFGPIFEIAKCFRNGDSLGAHHNPEFTMLEWYTPETSYWDQIDIVEALITSLSSHAEIDVRVSWEKMSVNEAFLTFLGVDLIKYQDRVALLGLCKRMHLSVDEEDSWETLFNLLFLTGVEPFLPTDTPLILYDYPVQVHCLAECIPGTPWRARWELYWKGVELANCFSEETDKNAVTRFIEHEKASIPTERHNGVAHDFPELFSESYPSCSGVALGIDRLIMVLLAKKTIHDVMLFTEPD